MQAKKNNVMLDSQNGLIQGVSDNFDANLSTQNGLKQIHSLASVILQHRKVPQEDKREPIPRLKKRELASAKLKEPEMKISKGQKKPSMPNSYAQRAVIPLRILCSQSIMVARSEAIDVLTQPSVPDFAGYNTKQMRESGQIMKTKSKLIFIALINKTPSDPSTMLTAMWDIKDASHQAGQQVTVFTCDQQLYRVIMDIIWEDPVRWKHFYPRIGGMQFCWGCWKIDEK